MTGPSVPFDVAMARFLALLASEGWPGELHFVPESAVLFQRPPRVLVFGANAGDKLAAGRLAFAEAQRLSVPAELVALGHRSGVAYACVRVLVAPAQGQDMFLADGLQVSALQPPRAVRFCRSRLWWRYASWVEARRIGGAVSRIGRAA